MVRRAAVLSFVFFVSACGAESCPEGAKVTGLHVESIQDSGLTFTAVNVGTGEKAGSFETDETVELPAGTYHLYRQGRPKWVFAERVVVTEGEVARVKLAAIRVNVADTSWDDTLWDIRLPDDAGDAVMAPLDPNVLVPIAAGKYVLTQHYRPEFRYGVVEMVPGQIGQVTLGALVAANAAANDDNGFMIYAEDCVTVLDAINDGRLTHAVPAGTYCLKDRDVPNPVLANGIVVNAGEVVGF